MSNKDKDYAGTFEDSDLYKKLSVGSATIDAYGISSIEGKTLHVYGSTIDIIVAKEVDTAWLRTCVTNEGEAKAFEAYNETVSEKQKLTFEEYMKLYSRLKLKDYLKK